MYIFFRFLLNVAHFLCNVYCCTQQQIARFFLSIQDRGYLNKFNSEYSLTNSKDQLLQKSKIPSHLAILLGHEAVSIIDLIKLISWCIVAEIPYVSFYDHNGILQRNQYLIQKKLDEIEPSITQKVEWTTVPNNASDNIKIIAKTNDDKFNLIQTNIIHADATDLINKCKTKIRVLSYRDGKDEIVTLTKSFAKLSHLNILQEQDITVELLDEKLHVQTKIPDPDLAIIFGKTLCTYGFLPWQARVTEFFTLPTHHDISSTSFLKTLIKFSKCEQRYGK